jgi:hypothetical protein
MDPLRRRNQWAASGGVMIGRKKRSPISMVVAYHKAGLAIWLQRATDGLTAPVKERIGSEVESHYAETVDAHIANGLSEADARKAALAELGDANDAARRFRRQYLTEQEVKAAKQMLIAIHSRGRLLISYVWFVMLSIVFWWLLRHGESNRLILTLCYIVLSLVIVFDKTVYFMVFRRRQVVPNMRVFLRMQMLHHTISILGLTFIMATRVNWLLWSNSLFWGIDLIASFRLWFKLRKSAAFCDEIRPLSQ